MKYLTILVAWLFVTAFLRINIKVDYKLLQVISLNFLSYLQIELRVFVSAVGTVLKIRHKSITT